MNSNPEVYDPAKMVREITRRKYGTAMIYTITARRDVTEVVCLKNDVILFGPTAANCTSVTFEDTGETCLYLGRCGDSIRFVRISIAEVDFEYEPVYYKG